VDGAPPALVSRETTDDPQRVQGRMFLHPLCFGSSSFVVDTCWLRLTVGHDLKRHDRTRETEERRTARPDSAAYTVVPTTMPLFAFLRSSVSLVQSVFPRTQPGKKVSTTDDEDPAFRA
jgi:hypothetical protein